MVSLAPVFLFTPQLRGGTPHCTHCEGTTPVPLEVRGVFLWWERLFKARGGSTAVIIFRVGGAAAEVGVRFSGWCMMEVGVFWPWWWR